MSLRLINKLSLKNISLVLFSLSAWFGLRPYLILKYDLALSIFIYASFLLLIIFNNYSNNQKNLFFAFIYVFLCFYFILPGEGSPNKTISLGFLSAGIIIFLTRNEQIRLYEIFRYIYIITLIPSLLIYFLDIGGLNIPYNTVSGFKEESETGLYFIAFLGNVKTILSDSFIMYRFQGMYDEPGVIGTVSGLLLLLENFNFKKRRSYILLISGIFSFSMAFYLLVLLYVFFVKRLNIKYIFAISIFISSLFIFESTRFYIVNRFSYNEKDSSFKFDNRVSNSFQGLFYTKITNGNIENKLFGYGYNAHTKYKYDVSSYKILIYNKGYIGFFALLLFYFLFTIYNVKEWQSRIIILIFLTTIYHRPHVVSLYFSLLFICGISLLNSSEKQKLINKKI